MTKHMLSFVNPRAVIVTDSRPLTTKDIDEVVEQVSNSILGEVDFTNIEVSFDNAKKLVSEINMSSVVPVDDDFLRKLEDDILKHDNDSEKVLSLVQLAAVMGRFKKYKHAYYFYYTAFRTVKFIRNLDSTDADELVYCSLIGIARLLLMEYTTHSEIAEDLFEYLTTLIPDDEAEEYLMMLKAKRSSS
jgi:hypothetical protein